MSDRINAILIHEKDNVVTVTEEVKAGDSARYRRGDEIIEIIAREDIPKFHKIAREGIASSGRVTKYGEEIGKALVDIPAGSHVHDHNIESPGKETGTEGETP